MLFIFLINVKTAV